MKDSEYELRGKREYLLQMGKGFTENYRDLKDLGSFLLTVTAGQKHLHRSRSQGFPGGPVVENPPCNEGTPVRPPLWEDPTCHRGK